MYPPRDICPFVMYCVNGKPRSSLLIESTDSMITLICAVLVNADGGRLLTFVCHFPSCSRLRSTCLPSWSVSCAVDKSARSAVYIGLCTQPAEQSNVWGRWYNEPAVGCNYSVQFYRLKEAQRLCVPCVWVFTCGTTDICIHSTLAEF